MWNLIKKDFREIFYNRKGLIVCSIVSIIFIVGTYCNTRQKAQETAPSIVIGVVDQDKSFYSKMLIQYFNENSSFQSYAALQTGELQEMQERFQTGELQAYLVLPENFAQNLMQMQNNPIQAKISTTDTTVALLLKNMLESYGKYISAVETNCAALYQAMQEDGMETDLLSAKNLQISKELIFMALGRGQFFRAEEGNRIHSVSLKDYYLQAILALSVLYLGLYGGFCYLKEKSTQTLERLRLSNISRLAYFGEKILFSTGVISVLFFILWCIRGMARGTCLSPYILLAYAAIIVCSVCLGLILAVFCKNTKSFLLTSNILYLCMAIVGGAIIPMMYLPNSFCALAKVTPVYWFIKMLLMVS